MSSSVVKISPIPNNLTEQQIKEELGASDINKVIVMGSVAYVTLASPQILEKLAGKYGDDLKVQSWNSTIEPLDSSFNIDSVVAETTHTEKSAGPVSSTLRQGENILEGVVSGVKDLIGSGINKVVGPTVNFKEYSEKVKKVVNVLLAVWLICLLN